MNHREYPAWIILVSFSHIIPLLVARRISAISIADRVAQEQCLENVGSLVGYQVRLEAAAGKDTQLLFVTPGILLRRLQSSPTLSEFTHIILDEVHERDINTDFLLILLRDLLSRSVLTNSLYKRIIK